MSPSWSTVLGRPSSPLASLAAFQHATVFTASAALLAGLTALLLIRGRRRVPLLSGSPEPVAGLLTSSGRDA